MEEKQTVRKLLMGSLYGSVDCEGHSLDDFQVFQSQLDRQGFILESEGSGDLATDLLFDVLRAQAQTISPMGIIIRGDDNFVLDVFPIEHSWGDYDLFLLIPKGYWDPDTNNIGPFEVGVDTATLIAIPNR